MKTNRSARKARKLQITILCLATAALAVIGFRLGESLAVRFGQANVHQTEGPQAPNFDLGVLMASMR
jgi:hypothetical protein